MTRLAILLLCWLLPLVCHAGAPAVLTKSPPSFSFPTSNTAKVDYVSSNAQAANNRTFSLPGAANDGVYVSDAVSQVVGGVVLDLVINRVVPAVAFPEIAVGTAVALGVAYAAGKVPSIDKYFTDNAISYSPTTGFTQFSGAQTPVSVKYRCGNYDYYSSYSAACNAYLDSMAAYWTNYGKQYGNTYVKDSRTVTSDSAVEIFHWVDSSGKASSSSTTSATPVATSGSYCAYVPGGSISSTAPIGGVCPSGSPQVIPAGDVPPLLKTLPANAPGVVQEGLSNGVPGKAGPIQINGPAKAPAGTVTQSSPAGSTITNVTNNYTYNGDTITYNKTAETTNPDGSKQSVTDTNPQDLRSDCEKHPNTIGCAQFGDIPTDKPEWKTKTVDYAPDSLGLPSGCPAPKTISLRNWDLHWSYQPLCDVAPVIRAGILALAAVGALLFIVGTVKT